MAPRTTGRIDVQEPRYDRCGIRHHVSRITVVQSSRGGSFGQRADKIQWGELFGISSVDGLVAGEIEERPSPAPRNKSAEAGASASAPTKYSGASSSGYQARAGW